MDASAEVLRPRKRRFAIRISIVLVAILTICGFVLVMEPEAAGSPKFLKPFAPTLKKPTFLMGHSSPGNYLFSQEYEFTQPPALILSALRKKLVGELKWKENYTVGGTEFRNGEASEQAYVYDSGMFRSDSSTGSVGKCFVIYYRPTTKFEMYLRKLSGQLGF